MIKVVEAISDLNIGGAGVLLVNRLRHTDKNLFDTTVVIPAGSQLKNRLSHIGVKSVELDVRGDRSVDVRGIYEYIKVLRRIKPDILNAHGCLSARIAARIVGVPTKLYTRHCVYPIARAYKLSLIRAAFGFFCDFLSDGVIAVAYSARDDLVKMGIRKSKIKVIINGAEGLRRISKDERENLRKKLGIGTEDFVVIICARLEECKDHGSFLNAAALLCKKSEGFVFLVVGGGSREEELKAKCKALGIEHKVIFTGFIEDTAPYMNISDLNVNCSVGTETSSLALSEGMSIGLPCVVSDYGGNTYMVRDGENGFVYKARDHVELSQKIELVRDMRMISPEAYESLCAKSLERYREELNAIAMTLKTQKYYVEMLKKYRPTR